MGTRQEKIDYPSVGAENRQNVRRTKPALCLIVVSILGLGAAPVRTQAQQWSGILAPSRAVDWTNAGVTGGIPNRTTICSTLSPGASASQINSAIASCPSGQVVFLNAGTYNLNSGITFAGHNNVTLRGAGANQTLLVFTGSNSCLGQGAIVCMPGADLSYYGPGPPTHNANWTGGYAKGTTTITVDSTTGLSPGMYIVLDQLDDASDTGDIYVCVATSCTVQGGGGGSNGRSGRTSRQMVQVTNISGLNLTISPGVYMPQFRSSQSPGAWWGNSSALIHDDGVEDLSIDGTSAGASAANVSIIFAHDCWVRGIRSVNAPTPRAHIVNYQAAHITIRDNYLFGSVGGGGSSLHYGVEDFGTADNLIENNIVQQRTSPFVSDGDQGSVRAHNFSINDLYTVSLGWMQASQYSHEGGNGMVLDEGNFAIGYKGDIIHATSNLFTFFRGYSIGWEVGKTAETNPVKLYSYQRYWAFIGNVLGKSGYHNTYEGGNTAIYAFGVGSTPIPGDPITKTSSMRWGNYDVVTGAARWCGNSSNPGWTAICGGTSEVPSTIAAYPNPVPSSTTLPASFYLPGKPAWWVFPSGLASTPFPAIGPDVTGGNVAGVGGFAYLNPAANCYFNIMGGPSDGSGSVLNFNANSCYGSANSTQPAPPSGLQAVVH